MTHHLLPRCCCLLRFLSVVSCCCLPLTLPKEIINFSSSFADTPRTGRPIVDLVRSCDGVSHMHIPPRLAGAFSSTGIPANINFESANTNPLLSVLPFVDTSLPTLTSPDVSTTFNDLCSILPQPRLLPGMNHLSSSLVLCLMLLLLPTNCVSMMKYEVQPPSASIAGRVLLPSSTVESDSPAVSGQLLSSSPLTAPTALDESRTASAIDSNPVDVSADLFASPDSLSFSPGSL